MSGPYTIRPFETIEEYQNWVALQEATCGHGFSERVSPAILKVSQTPGCVAVGSYDAEGVLTGFVFRMKRLNGVVGADNFPRRFARGRRRCPRRHPPRSRRGCLWCVSTPRIAGARAWER